MAKHKPSMSDEETENWVDAMHRVVIPFGRMKPMRGDSDDTGVSKPEPTPDESKKVAGALMTKRDVAEFLHCSISTVSRLIADGQIPSLKVGKLRRFRKTDIDAWLSGEGAENSDD